MWIRWEQQLQKVFMIYLREGMSGPNVMSNHLAVVKTFHWNTEMWDSSWRKRGKSEVPQSQRIHHVGSINTKFLGKPAHRNISVWTKVELANVSILHPTSSPLVLISLSQSFFFPLKLHTSTDWDIKRVGTKFIWKLKEFLISFWVMLFAAQCNSKMHRWRKHRHPHQMAPCVR